jgi:hypothetical protein
MMPAPEPPPSVTDPNDDGYDLDDDNYCPRCGDEEPDSWESACPDDLCHGGEVPCMHGDYARLPCALCGK